MNIHGQHDNQQLLNPEFHCVYIDKLAENEALKHSYYSEFKKLNCLRRELRELEANDDENSRKAELLEHQIKELEGAAIKPGEREELRKQLRLSENSAKLIALLENSKSALDGNDDLSGAVQLTASAGKSVSSCGAADLSDIGKRLTELSYELAEISSDIEQYLSKNDFSEIKTEELRERLDFIYRLMLKYGNSEEKMLEFLQNAKEELQNISYSDKREAELSNELDSSTERLIAIGNMLTESRRKAASKLEKNVTEALKYLDMPNVKFVAEIKKGRYTKEGCDELQFLISANTGEPPKPLSRIASGGELSRIMLAIKSVLADKDDVDTLIFDEIDTGISGYAAIKVGQKLRQVSKIRQVLCVTHLAQIAAAAEQQLLIKKNISSEKTYTDVSALGPSERIKELARIMSGGELTENLLKSAKELLDRSNSNDYL